MMLAKLAPPQRRYVIGNFKAASGDSTTELGQFIAKCEQTNAWVAGPTPVAPAATTMTTPGVAKRPLTPVAPIMDASKRPCLVTPGTAAPQAVRPVIQPVVRPPTMTGAVAPPRPGGPRPVGLVRPPGLVT